MHIPAHFFARSCVDPIDDLPCKFNDTALDAARQLDNKARMGHDQEGLFFVQKLVESITQIITEAKKQPPVMYPSRPCALYVLDWAYAQHRDEEVVLNLKGIKTVQEALQISLDRAEWIKVSLEGALDLVLDEEQTGNLVRLCLKLSSTASNYIGPRIRY